MDNFEIFDSTFQNYGIEYNFQHKTKEVWGYVKDKKENLLGYIQGSMPGYELKVSLKDSQNSFIIEVSKEFSLFNGDFQFTNSVNLPNGIIKSRPFIWNSFLLNDSDRNNLMKFEFKVDKILMKRPSGGQVAKCLFDKIKTPRQKLMERITNPNPEHYRGLISIQNPLFEKRYVFGAILYYIGKKHLEFYLKGGDLPAG
jgi:hypothetical protein